MIATLATNKKFLKKNTQLLLHKRLADDFWMWFSLCTKKYRWMSKD